jgi:predicted GNAT family acetyltransferase
LFEQCRGDTAARVQRQEETRMADDKAAEMTVRDNPEQHRFEIDLGDSMAIAEYIVTPTKIIFSHTEVPPAHEGKGIGSILIKAGLASARTRGLKVIPTCPFFASYMKRHPETHDLLDDSYRKIFGLDG